MKKILTLTVAVMLVLGMLIPAVSLAEFVMYVYTENGKNLNVRIEPSSNAEIVTTLPFGSTVHVDYHMGNGWSAINWAGDTFDDVYVQTRFLVYDKPTKKPSSKTSGSSGSASSGINELNTIFRTYRQVNNAYRVTVRPTRASGWVNVRFAPSKETELLSTHADGDQLLVIAELSDWYQVEDPDTGAVGYVSSKFVVK